MKKEILFTWSLLFYFIVSGLQAQVSNQKESVMYKNALRNLIPDKWYLTAPAMLRVTLKEGTQFKQLKLDSVYLDAQLDSIRWQGYSSIEIFATPHGGKSFGGLDAIDRYTIDPAAGNMEDFKRLVRQAHRKQLAIIAFDNLGYSSIDAPHFLKACADMGKGIVSKETKWFTWADSNTADPPMQPDRYFLGGSKRWEKWVYNATAKKYFWSKWDGVDKQNKPCSLPQYNWSPEWQQEVKNIVHFWMITGIDGMVVDAVNWYTKYTWQMGKECITDIIKSYGNTFLQPEGAGGFHEDPVPWITDGGWNCVQDYGLGIWWEKDNNILINAININNPSGLEEALQNYHDRVVAEGGILYIGADKQDNDPSRYHLYVAFSMATGHLYCKSMQSSEHFTIDTTLASVLRLKKEHRAFDQNGSRQRLPTNDDHQYYAFLQKAKNNEERILCVFNFQASSREVSVDLSSINTNYVMMLPSLQTEPYAKQFKVSLPAYGYRFYKIP